MAKGKPRKDTEEKYFYVLTRIYESIERGDNRFNIYKVAAEFNCDNHFCTNIIKFGIAENNKKGKRNNWAWLTDKPTMDMAKGFCAKTLALRNKHKQEKLEKLGQGMINFETKTPTQPTRSTTTTKTPTQPTRSTTTTKTPTQPVAKEPKPKQVVVEKTKPTKVNVNKEPVTISLFWGMIKISYDKTIA